MNQKVHYFLPFIMLLGLLWMPIKSSYAQGTTTASMSGLVTDTNGESLPGATLIAIHTPSGSQYGTTTRTDGRYNFANLQVGGPYQVTISFVGYKDLVYKDVFLSLGQDFILSPKLQDESVELGAVEVVAGGLLSSDRSGAETSIREEEIAALPTISRSLEDFTRLTPQISTSGEGTSIAGTNNRYNAIYIDGAINSDVFGLSSSGTNGGQTGITPISIDAIDQFQVVVAPYDVTLGGFTGGGINATTRSGSNQLEGSVYYYLQNQDLVGKTPGYRLAADAERSKVADFSSQRYGFRLGGPIIKNKLFFFVNGELFRDKTPLTFDFGQYEGDATEAQLNAFADKLRGLGYDPGVFGDKQDELKDNKFLARIDWNLMDNHRLSFTHSYSKGEEFNRSVTSNRTINFANNGIYFPSTTNFSKIELNSIFSNSLSNNLIVGYTRVRDDRDPLGENFPRLSIQDGSGFISAGSEIFSTANRLDQDIFTITNNLKLYKGKHTFTIGTHNEFYKILNLFIRRNFGEYAYDSLSQFMNDLTPTDYERSYALNNDTPGDNSGGASEFSAMQLGFYIQDEFALNDRLTLTGGLRLDIPIFSDEPETDTYFNNTTIPAIEAEGYDLKGARAGQMPKTSLMLSPRLGFNLDATGDRSTIIRGGLGIFTGRIPFVWPGGAFLNNGLTVGSTFQSGEDVTFNADPNNQPTATDFGGTDPVPSGQIDLFEDGFKYPQVFRTSLAVDKKLGASGIVATLEGIYSKTLNNIFYENLNLRPSTQNLTGTPDNRPLFNRRDEIDDTYGRILLGSNTSEGYTYNVTAQLQKPFKNGLTANLSYTFGRSTQVFEGTSSQNSSQWRGAVSVDGRNVTPLGRSDFDFGHKFTGFLSYRLKEGNFGATTFSLFYNGQSGSPFTYIYNDGGSLNNEDSRERNAIYIPNSQSDIILVQDGDRTPEQQWSDLNAFIESDPYLSENRGGYAEKNLSRTPFESNLDLRILQDFYVNVGNSKNTIQLSLDILNFTNLLNKDWGRDHFASNGVYELIDFEGFQEDGTTPTFSFTAKDRDEIWSINDFNSRWRMQLGLRYIFN